MAVLLVFGAAACGDDDDEQSEAASASAYCDLARELDAQEDFPSDEQLDALAEAAPDEIAEDVEFVAGKFKEDGPDAFSDPEVGERFGPIEEFEADECEIASDDDEEAMEGTSFEIDPDAQRIDVTALDYDFEFDTPEAGPVSFVMTNEGEEPHFMFIGKLLGDATLDEALQSEDPVEEGLAEDIGESEVASPGGEAVLTVEDLEPGNYAMLCFIPTPDGTPHALEGMAVEFTVDS